MATAAKQHASRLIANDFAVEVAIMSVLTSAADVITSVADVITSIVDTATVVVRRH
jgi:hypothetical protein